MYRGGNRTAPGLAYLATLAVFGSVATAWAAPTNELVALNRTATTAETPSDTQEPDTSAPAPPATTRRLAAPPARLASLGVPRLRLREPALLDLGSLGSPRGDSPTGFAFHLAPFGYPVVPGTEDDFGRADFGTGWGEPTGPLFDPIYPTPAPTSPLSVPLDRSSSAGTADDDRSAWARWNATLPGVSTTALAFMVTMVAGFTLLPKDVTGWNQPEFDGLKGNFTEGPRFDNDRYYFNYIAHPIDGSEFYMMARNRKLTWWQSLMYSAAMSASFEFLVESAYERASWQDLWITPVSGAFLGEVRWQLKKSLENPYSGKPIGTLNKVLYVVIDPLEAVYKL